MSMFFDVLDAVDKYEMEADERLEFKAELLSVFLNWDIDPSGLEDDPIVGPIYARLQQKKAE